MTEKLVRSTLLAAALVATAWMPGAAWAQGSVTVASWGGEYQKALRKAFYDPVEAQLGIKVLEDTLDGIGSVRVQVQAGAVNWDVAELGVADCMRGEQEGLYEKLDYGIIDASGIDPALVGESWIGAITFATLIAWNTDTYGTNGPQNWADFWNVEKFPGSRSLNVYPAEALPAAVMADGVSPQKVYPLDVDRAFRSLEKLKPHVIAWWSSGAQATQMLKDGEVDMIAVWNGRLINVIKDGAHASYTFNEGILDADCLVIPKGSKNKDLAMKVIAAIVSPDIQANLPKHISNGPVNMKAFETGKISAQEADAVVSSPKNAKVQLLQNSKWWLEHEAKVQERFDEFRAE